jgi:hypothetical protein
MDSVDRANSYACTSRSGWKNLARVHHVGNQPDSVDHGVAHIAAERPACVV